MVGRVCFIPVPDPCFRLPPNPGTEKGFWCSAMCIRFPAPFSNEDAINVCPCARVGFSKPRAWGRQTRAVCPCFYLATLWLADLHSCLYLLPLIWPVSPPLEPGDGKRFVTLANVTSLYAAASRTKKGFLACARIYITKPGNRGFVTLKR